MPPQSHRFAKLLKRSVSGWFGFSRQVALYIVVLLLAGGVIRLGFQYQASSRHAFQSLDNTLREVRSAFVAREVEYQTSEMAESCLRFTGLRTLSVPARMSAGQNWHCASLIRSLFLIQNGELVRATGEQRLGERLASDLKFNPPFVPGKLYPLAYANPPTQILYLQLTGSTILAATLNLDWIVSYVARDAGALLKAEVIIGPAEGGQGTHFPFMFPFWRIGAQPRDPSSLPSSPSVGTVVLGSVGLALVFGALMLIFDHWQQRSASKYRGDLIQAHSHDGANALNIILQSAEHLQRIFKTGRQKDYCRYIQSAAFDLSISVKSLLDQLSHEERNRTYRFQSQSLRELVERHIENARPFLDQHGVHLTLASEDLPDLPLDQEAAGRAIMNLLQNAVKHGGSGKRIEVRMFLRDANVVVEFRDFGPGIPARLTRKIFEPYFRGADSRDGSGLGLALVKRTMEVHGGRVEVGSAPGEGAIFRLSFPICSRS